MKNICIVTGTRAEYGLLKKVIQKLKQNKYFDIKLVVTGSHLSHLHGYTVSFIENDFNIDYKLNMMLSDDTPSALGKSVAIEMMGLSDYFATNKFDGVMLLGDRYEMLGVATIATIFQIRIIHLCGGDVTEGAYDDNIRHAITQLSHIHFVTCEESKRKVESFGRDNIYLVGNPGLETLLSFQPYEKNIDNYVMFVYHPETKNLDTMDKDLINIEQFFDYLIKINRRIVVIGSNADNQYNRIMDLYKKYGGKLIYKVSIEREQYLSLSYHSNLFMGNSSSGLYEIPYFEKYVINIGNRQKGRRNINNVINIPCEYPKMKECLELYENKKAKNDGHYPVFETSKLIEDILQKL